ncbi:Fibulin-2 [Saguinus oedipus]|uniref:Fibulin-2 n=1 Tax=Saguinus oedipus TaxID=9490 RepID=A0ABQ9U2X1_SAGOE|nr:Fibulin-2 [Saguinus oedipus]
MAGREALSLGTEAELPNSLPGDDQDECLLLPGELCQHLCINTVGSYHCACFPGFSLQDDGRTCHPGECGIPGVYTVGSFTSCYLTCWNPQEPEAPSDGEFVRQRK